MKKPIILSQLNAFLWMAVLSLILSACQDRVEITREYTVFEPVYMSLADIREGVEVIGPKPIEARGNIYLYKHWIMINEPGNGIHVIDNTNPESPVATQFINLPGNYSFSVRNDHLYADSYMDLVVLDISDMEQVTESSRIEDIFIGFSEQFVLDADSGVVISYEPVRVVQVSIEEVGGEYEDIYMRKGFFGLAENAFMASSDASIAPMPQSQTGIGGSMATYTIVNDYLYAMDESTLHTFNISNADQPVKSGELFLGWDIETLFPYGDNLFVGAQSGMYILSNTDQATPSFVSKYEHMVSCDPVVVQGDRAYVTLRSENTCRDALNQLEVINISDLNNPTLIAAYPMTSPHGLGIDGATLFVCEGESGFKVFDASDDLKIADNFISGVTDLDAYDVIPHDNILYLIGSDGLYQYDYTDPAQISFISKLEINSSSEF